MKPHLALIALCTALTACSLAPDFTTPTERVPDTWRAASISPKDAAPVTWNDFNSKELDALIATALKNNTDLSAALARIEQSRANARIAGSGLYPQVDASGSAGRNRSDSGNIRRTDDSSQVGVNISYELDLWQRNDNMLDAALWDLRASQFDTHALEIVVASEVARLYSGVLAFDARLEVADKNLTNARETLRITGRRHSEGAVSGLEHSQQQTAVSNTEAAVASLKNQRDLFFNQLALVVGTAPVGLKLDDTASLRALTIPTVPLGDPWSLLARRPDIGAAEARLKASNIDIGVARANALPSLSLALDASATGSPSGTLVGLAASFFAPIFHGGALQADIDRSKAVRDEQVAQYQTVLLTAFREVEDALSNLDAANARRTSLGNAAEAARNADRIAKARFDAGSIDFTTLLDTQNALLQAEDGYYSAIQAQLAATIDLMRALGGPLKP